MGEKHVLGEEPAALEKGHQPKLIEIVDMDGDEIDLKFPCEIDFFFRDARIEGSHDLQIRRCDTELQVRGRFRKLGLLQGSTVIEPPIVVVSGRGTAVR